jgi:hypothetical protein
MTCSECGGPAFSTLILAEKHDACYNKVRSRYKVWPSAYASGALVQCRKKGAANWGNKTKNEDVAEGEKSPMVKDAQRADRIRSLKNLIAIAQEQGRQLRVQELELELKKLQGVTEMDKSAPQPGRDGRVSHSTYGSRDKGGSKGTEREARPITAKKAKQDALDILKKQGVAEGSEQRWRVTVGNKSGTLSHTKTFTGTKEQAIKQAVTRFATSKNPVVTAELVKQDVAENYPKHQDLSGVSTEKLKAYLARQSQQSVPGEGSQVKRVQAELQRRSQGVAEGSGGVSVRQWANQVRKDHGADVKFRNRQEGSGAVDSVIARNSQGETVGVYNRKTGYPTVYEPKQDVTEGLGNIGSAIKSLYQKIYRAGDDEIEYFYNASPIFAQYWDEYEL